MDFDEYFEGRTALHVLSDAQVLEIKSRYIPRGWQPDGTYHKGNAKDLSREFGVSYPTIINLLNGYTYSWVHKNSRPSKKIGYLSDDDVRYIRANYNPGAPGNHKGSNAKQLTRKFDIHVQTLYNIVRGDTYRHVK
jgi:hypothetical protein